MFYCPASAHSIILTSLPMCGFIAQLVEQRSGNAEVTGSNPVEAPIFFFFFRLLLFNFLNWKIYCDDHSSLSLYSQFVTSSLIFFVCLMTDSTSNILYTHASWNVSQEHCSLCAGKFTDLSLMPADLSAPSTLTCK